MTEASEVLTRREGRAGVVRLNRPKALNALTLGMVRAVAAALDVFAEDPAVAFVLLEGEGERSFCAGGDIRAIHAMGRTDLAGAAAFWREEYRLDSAISRFPKPVVVLMHGIVMGGGAGLSIHAGHRIVFGDTRFAMPEVGIGFVPDVGSTYRLARAPGGLGRFLAYTGTTVGAADVIAAGLADAHVPAAARAELRAALSNHETGDPRTVMARFACEPADARPQAERRLIERAFAGGVDAALEALDADGSDFAAQTATLVRSRSPTSLRFTEFLLARAGAAQSLEAALNDEFAVALSLLREDDFYEGVRAAVIDKDRNPRWRPAELAALPVLEPHVPHPPEGLPPPFPSKEATP